MKTKIRFTKKSVWSALIAAALIITGTFAMTVSGASDKITITNEHLYKKLESDGGITYKFVMDVSFPSLSDLRNPNEGRIISGTYSIKLNRVDGKKENILGYVAMDYSPIGEAHYVQVTIFDAAGTKPIADSKSISIKDAEIED